MLTVRVPATTANLGPGFDTLGLALSLFLEVKMELSPEHHQIDCRGEDAEKLAKDLESNLVLQAALQVLRRAGRPEQGLSIHMNNAIPVGKGLGSSASAIVAGMFGVNELLGHAFSSEQVLAWAVEMEGHADNIVPAVAGGLTTAMLLGGQVHYQKIVPPDDLNLVLAVPDFVLPTQQSRSVLPSKLGFDTAVETLQKACFLIASIANNDLEEIHKAMDDRLVQPLRKTFIPGFDQVVEQARQAGAKGVALSGAGPSIIAFANGQEQEIGQAMQKAFAGFDIDCRILILSPCREGIQVFHSLGES